MTGIKIVLSTPEAVQRFRDVVKAMIQLHGRLANDVRTILEQKAEEYGVHPVDYRQILANYSPAVTDVKESTQCPVCHKGVEAPLPSFCDECGWDFDHDLTLHTFVVNPSDGAMDNYKKRLKIVKRLYGYSFRLVRERHP